MVCELFAQALMCAIRLGDDHETACLLVEAMHDARSLDAADAGQARAAMGEQSVDKGAAVMPGGRVHNESRRLVDDNKIVILVDDIEFDGLRDRLGRLGGGQFDSDPLAILELSPCFANRLPLDRDVALRNKSLKAGTARRRKSAG